MKNRIDFLLSSTYTPMKIIPNDFNNDKVSHDKVKITGSQLSAGPAGIA